MRDRVTRHVNYIDRVAALGAALSGRGGIGENTVHRSFHWQPMVSMKQSLVEEWLFVYTITFDPSWTEKQVDAVFRLFKNDPKVFSSRLTHNAKPDTIHA
jgi:hypothetical protein